jgi:hypothetical protein
LDMAKNPKTRHFVIAASILTRLHTLQPSQCNRSISIHWSSANNRHVVPHESLNGHMAKYFAHCEFPLCHAFHHSQWLVSITTINPAMHLLFWIHDGKQ